MKKILLVEDNESIVLGLKYSLEQEKFQVITAKNKKEAVSILEKYQFDLCLLDISLPDGTGYEICKIIKRGEDFPVIFLTAKDEEENVILGLDMGADDYISKPFRIGELISRINSVLRRYDKQKKNERTIEIKNIKIDLDKAKAFKNQEEIILTSLEYKILVMLFENYNILISRERLMEKIWDIDENYVNDNTLTVYIKRIRQKIGDQEGNIIKTVRGLGYIVGDNDENI